MAKNESSYESRVSTRKFLNLQDRVFRIESSINTRLNSLEKGSRDLKGFLDVLLGVLMKHTDIDQEIAGLLNELLRKGA